MAKTKKRVLSLVLSLAMLLTLLPATALAAGTEGKVTVTKTLQSTEPDANGNYTIQLTVQGNPVTTQVQPNADVILVVDNSGSMATSVGDPCTCVKDGFKEVYPILGSITGIHTFECPICKARYYTWEPFGLPAYDGRPDVCIGQTGSEPRIDTAKKVSRTFADNILAQPSNQLGVIGFSHDNYWGGADDSGAIWVSQGLTNDVNAVKTAINKMVAEGGTNYSAALQQAYEWISGRTNQTRPAYVVFISDGAPGRSGESITDPAWNGSAQAEALKAAGVELYTIGIALNGDEAAYLSSLASDADHYRNVTGTTYATELETILNEWASEINSVPAGTSAVLTDVVNTEKFTVVNASTNLQSAGDGKTFTWTIGDIPETAAVATIVVHPKEGVSGDDIPTNESVSFTYQDPSGTKVTLGGDAIGNPTVDIAGEIPDPGVTGFTHNYGTVVPDHREGDQQGTANVEIYLDGTKVDEGTIDFPYVTGSGTSVTLTANENVGAQKGKVILSSAAVMRSSDTQPDGIFDIAYDGTGELTQVYPGATIYLFYSTLFTVDGAVEVDGKSAPFNTITNSQFAAWYGSLYAMNYGGGSGARTILNSSDSKLVADDTNLLGSGISTSVPLEVIKNYLTSVEIGGTTYTLNTIQESDISVWNGTAYEPIEFTNGTSNIDLNISHYLNKTSAAWAIINAAVAKGFVFDVKVTATEKVEKFNLYGWFVDDGSGLDIEELEAYNYDEKYVSPSWQQQGLVKGTDHPVTFYAPEGLVITAYQQKGGEKISLIEDGKGKSSHTCSSKGDGADGNKNVNFYVYLTKDENGDLIPDRDQFTVTWKNYDGTVLEVDRYVTADTMPQYDGLTPVKPADMYYVYTFAGWTPALTPVSGNVEYTAVFTSTYIPPYIPPVNPPVDIEDPDVPLADLPGLNTKDHYAYIAGYPDGTVQPNGNITRAEVATIFFRLFTEEYRNTFWSVSAPFTDVEATDWFNTEVATVASAGVVAGYPDGTFLPNNNITRAEFATIAARFLTEEYVGPDLFTDVSGHWAQEYINRAANAGWINGYPDGSFHPDAYITRAEAMTLVNNMLGRMPHEDHLLAGMKLWVDNPSTMWYYEAVQEATNGHDYDWAEDNSYEIWTSLTPDPDWEALEALWTSQNA